jgi:ABC-type branched-subunit amino acid transport system ATPase component
MSFLGRQVRKPNPTRLYREGLTRTFQQARIFPHLTLVENLVVAVARPWRAVARRAVDRRDGERALELLEDFGLAHLAHEHAASLSYGQKKLLEFATVLVGKPRLVLLDEPAAGVNPVMVEAIEGHIRNLNRRGLTFLVVEHNMNLVMRLCDPVVVLDHGTKLAEGPPSEIQSDARVLDAYLGA